MKNQTERRMIRIVGIWIGLFGVAILLTSFCLTLYADDYNYAIYFKEGASQFWNLTWQHYIAVNGRALMHFLCEVMLLFGNQLFAFYQPVLLILLSFLFAKTMRRERRTALLWCEALISLIFIVNIPIVIARETLFWITGSFNYLLPVVLAVCALLLAVRAVRRGKVKLYEVIACIVCGATTEQGGLIALTLVVCYYWHMTLTRRRVRGQHDGCFFLPVSILLGYLSVLLAPGTFHRAVNGASLFERILNGEIWITYAQISKDILGPNGFGIVIAFLFLGLGILRCLDKALPKSMLLGFVAAIGIFLCGMLPDQEEWVYTVLSCIAVLFMIYIAAVLFRSRQYHMLAFYLIAALLSQGMMLTVEKQMVRTVFPTALLLIACLSHLITEIFSKSAGLKWIPAGSCCFGAIGLILFLPTLNGYYQNTAIIRSNDQSIRDYAANGSAVYSLDITYPYYYTMFYENGLFVSSFYEYHDLPKDAKIYYRSENLPEIFVNDVPATHPALTFDGVTYLPMQAVLAAGGGKVSWTPDVTDIQFMGKEYQINNQTMQIVEMGSGKGEALASFVKLAYGKQYVQETTLNRIFGLYRQNEGEDGRIYLSTEEVE